jgi:hypothetical protein
MIKKTILVYFLGLYSFYAYSQHISFKNSISSDLPWWIPVESYQEIQPGEHPRLLFRKSDLPALRKKADTPEGQTIIAKLKYLLDGANGRKMPSIYSKAQDAYSLGKNKNFTLDSVGVYTFGHIVGYGLLYQLTGDKHYADLGRKSFELALAGQRDKDDRYSWVAPGGGLRAGPVLGWYAVGYDLCYDGWDEETREKFGKAIENYDAGIARRDNKAPINLETLTSGTMPPKSNHYGMQIGGAALALMAIKDEPWADNRRIDSLLKISEKSMIRNVTEGFGDGGFFAEGDGTGSMSSQIVYLTAIQAWKNAMGMDFINVERPNVRMTALKWLYLTVVRSGIPDFWPIRGAYPHNVWSREGLSGGGYFGIGMGTVTDEQKSAFKWFYNQFLLKTDLENGTPYEPSSYPHIVATAFVNWPVDFPETNPADVLPLCYRDSIFGFYAWRNRWQDENDIVISVLTKPAKGYMGAEADTMLQVAALGKKFSWGRVNKDVKSWNTNSKGDISTLAFADGTSIMIDFSKASGADAMLISTGEAHGIKKQLGSKELTFKFITEGEVPTIKVESNKILIGRRIITVKAGNILLN